VRLCSQERLRGSLNEGVSSASLRPGGCLSICPQILAGSDRPVNLALHMPSSANTAGHPAANFPGSDERIGDLRNKVETKRFRPILVQFFGRK